jgi:hypothetical protein
MPTARVVVVNLVLQALDGILTYVGLGLGYEEGNPVLAAGMAAFGVLPTLVVAKAFAAAGVVYLGYAGWYRTLWCTAISYVLIGILPWTILIAWGPTTP